MKIMNKCFNISRVSILAIIGIVLFSIMLIAGVTNNEDNQSSLIDKTTPVDSSTVWKPTQDDIDYQDSMWVIINRTQEDVDTIKEAIDHILIKLDRIEYKDGSYDSIRYVIEPTKENQSR